MAILDFKEIPPSTKNKDRTTDDLDAFEKFAEEFFVKIKGAELLDKCNRGPDSGIDLKIKYEDEICLVSCKHHAHTGKSVTPQDEESTGGLIDLLNQHKCTKFIGFYSTIASSGLKNKLDGLFKDNKNFSYELFYNSDIEAAILVINNPYGWLFAARHFPKSYTNLFPRFIIPIEYYNENSKELKKNGNSYTLDGPFGGTTSCGHLKEFIRNANDSLTSAIHKKFFYNAIYDAINAFPRYFVYKKIDNTSNKISIYNISPAWNEPLEPDYCHKTIKCNIPFIICTLWSFWNSKKSTQIFLHYREKSYNFIEKNGKKYFHEREIEFISLNFGTIAALLNGELRNLFARLVAFYPAGGIKTNLTLEEDGVTNFDPNKNGKSDINWSLDLGDDTYDWVKEQFNI